MCPSSNHYRGEGGKQTKEKNGLENEICKIREWRGMEKEERRKGKEEQNKTYTLFLAKTYTHICKRIEQLFSLLTCVLIVSNHQLNVILVL